MWDFLIVCIFFFFFLHALLFFFVTYRIYYARKHRLIRNSSRLTILKNELFCRFRFYTFPNYDFHIWSSFTKRFSNSATLFRKGKLFSLNIEFLPRFRHSFPNVMIHLEDYLTEQRQNIALHQHRFRNLINVWKTKKTAKYERSFNRNIHIWSTKDEGRRKRESETWRVDEGNIHNNSRIFRWASLQFGFTFF